MVTQTYFERKKMPEKSPVDFLLENREVVTAAYLAAKRSPKKTWDALAESLPSITRAMTFNSFKTFVRPFVQISEKLAPAETASQDHIKNLNGWTVHKGSDGYFRAHRKVDNIGFSVYIGKIFDPDKARAKIAAKEKKLADKKVRGFSK